jgi:hypothetical protein
MNQTIITIKDSIENLAEEIESVVECWKDKPIKGKIAVNWNPMKTDWRK